MKLISLLIFIVFAGNFHTQHIGESLFKEYKSPLEIPNSETKCGRDWMNSEHVMDSLKLIIFKLERKLASLTKDSLVADSTSLILLYSYEYVHRIEAFGAESHQLCIDAGKYGSRAKPAISKDGDLNKVSSYNSTYITTTETFYYLGNCQIWTTYKRYYIRADKFKLFAN